MTGVSEPWSSLRLPAKIAGAGASAGIIAVLDDDGFASGFNRSRAIEKPLVVHQATRQLSASAT